MAEVLDLLMVHQEEIRAVVGMWSFMAVLYFLIRIPKNERTEGDNARIERQTKIFFVVLALAWPALWLFLPE